MSRNSMQWITCISFFLFGMGFAGIFMNQAVDANSIADEIIARKITLVDSKGKKRIKIGSTDIVSYFSIASPGEVTKLSLVAHDKEGIVSLDSNRSGIDLQTGPDYSGLTFVKRNKIAFLSIEKDNILEMRLSRNRSGDHIKESGRIKFNYE